MNFKPLICFLFFFPLSTVLVAQENMGLSLEEHYQKGNEELLSFRFQAALDHFFECQRTEPDNPEYLSKVGYCYYQLGNLPEAKIYYKQVLKKDSIHVSSLNYLVTIEEQLLENRSAMANIQRLLALDSVNSYYYRTAGSLSEKLNETGKAVFFYLKALHHNPNDNAALISLCYLYAITGQLTLADSLLNAALFKQPKNLRLLYSSAETNYRLRQFEEVVAPLHKALAMGDTNIAYLPLLPYSLARLERCEEAIPWFEYYHQRRDPNEQTHYFLGFCYQKKQEIEKSLVHYQKAIELGISPNIPVYFQRTGDVNALQKDYRKSVQAYEKALEYGATDPVVFFHLATGYDHLHKKDKKKPLDFYNKYLRSNDQDNPEFRIYAAKRVGEIEDYIKNVWKGN